MGEVPSVRSRYGDAIADLIHAGWSLTSIARHIGCHHTTVLSIYEDPGHMPSWVIGECLIVLHAGVMSGVSRWGKLIAILRSAGMTTAEIAKACGVSSRAINQIESDLTRHPSHQTGQALMQLYRAAGD